VAKDGKDLAHDLSSRRRHRRGRSAMMMVRQESGSGNTREGVACKGIIRPSLLQPKTKVSSGRA
jgi:hypothetical protein